MKAVVHTDEGLPMGEHGEGVAGSTRDIGRDFKTPGSPTKSGSIEQQRLEKLPPLWWNENHSMYTGFEAGNVSYQIPPTQGYQPTPAYQGHPPQKPAIPSPGDLSAVAYSVPSAVSGTVEIPEKEPAPMTPRDAIVAAAKRHGVPPGIALAVAMIASGIDQTARGDNATGIFALPQGAGGMLHDTQKWRDNIEAGVMYLKLLREKEGSWAKAVKVHLGAAGLARVRKLNTQSNDAFPKGDRGLMTVAAPLPVQPTYLSDFGIRKAGEGGDFHSGIDIAAPRGTPVLAITGGKVKAATRAGAAGNFVTVRDASGREWSYAHLQDYLVKEGDVVKPGDRVGSLGSTGAATAPHLHLAVKVKGTWGNPLAIAKRAFGVPAGSSQRIDVSVEDFAAPAKGGQTVGAANAQPVSPLTGQPSRAQAWQNIVNAGPVGPETANLARQAGAVVPE